MYITVNNNVIYFKFDWSRSCNMCDHSDYYSHWTSPIHIININLYRLIFKANANHCHSSWQQLTQIFNPIAISFILYLIWCSILSVQNEQLQYHTNKLIVTIIIVNRTWFDSHVFVADSNNITKNKKSKYFMYDHILFAMSSSSIIDVVILLFQWHCKK